ncbi:hypothetical protein BDR04DRAFT_813955 [Suillus decipiens]|nr:hypothetical protein BDR04DRAFT_813955 [Suillus decipiens]
MSLSACKSVILTTNGKYLPLNHTFRGIVDRAMENILRCEALLNNYADNTFQSPSNGRDRRARVREIRKYLITYPPTINLLSFEPDHYVETQVKQAQKSPTSRRTYWNLSNQPNRQSSVCHIEVNKGLVDALNESKDNDDCGIFRMLSALTIIMIVHEIAHVIQATFAEMPTPREAGDSAENVISGNKGEFWAYYGTPGDYKTIETLQIRGAYTEDARGPGKPIQRQVTCAINGKYVPKY